MRTFYKIKDKIKNILYQLYWKIGGITRENRAGNFCRSCPWAGLRYIVAVTPENAVWTVNVRRYRFEYQIARRRIDAHVIWRGKRFVAGKTENEISERQAWASILKRRELLSSLYYLALCKDTLRKRDSLLREAGILLEVMRFTVAFCGMNWWISINWPMKVFAK